MCALPTAPPVNRSTRAPPLPPALAAAALVASAGAVDGAGTSRSAGLLVGLVWPRPSWPLLLRPSAYAWPVGVLRIDVGAHAGQGPDGAGKRRRRRGMG